jgi:hypothetical protein|tara:strand:+ start:854 stop:1606 length:753 start_codon:yes stop_codon:yes gene_type:complete
VTDEARQEFRGAGQNDDLIYDEELEQAYFKRFRMDEPEIEEFLNWSEKAEGFKYRVFAQSGGLEFVFSVQDEFERIGVKGEALVSCVDGNPHAIRLVCRKILRHFAEVGVRADKGETALVARKVQISTAIVRQFVLASMDGMERYDWYQPVPELHYLLKLMFMPGIPLTERRRRAEDTRYFSLFVAAAHFHKTGIAPSIREVAARLGVAPSTLSRMFDGPEDFTKQATLMHESFSSMNGGQYWSEMLPPE